ncbi:protein kinase [Bacillus sp. FSL W7-1360]
MVNNSDVHADWATEFYPGLVVRGKWHGQCYTLVRKLGVGVTGHVYLAQGQDGYVALKIGLDARAITTEVNVLKQLNKVQEMLGPCLYDVDDYVCLRGSAPFYAMEYIQGENVLDFMKGRSGEWVEVLLSQILTKLAQLHKQGLVFGDLKPENVLVTDKSYHIRLLDVGGVTEMGRAVKEYTEYYDRGYWELGSRRADPQYDLFSVAMMMIVCAYPARVNKVSGKTAAQLKKMVQKSPLLQPYQQMLLRALHGKYVCADDMRSALVKRKKGKLPTRKVVNRKRQLTDRVDLFLVASFVILLSVLYLLGEIF